MKRIIILFFMLYSYEIQAQSGFQSEGYDSNLSSAVSILDKCDFYFVGQAHGNKANVIIEKNLLFSLNNKFNVRYYILEFGQSLAFLLNQYLETGQDSILNFINATGNFDLVKTVRKFNDTVADSKRIKFFGLDFENRLNGKWTRKAMEIISEKIKLPVNNPLQILLNAVIKNDPDSEKANLLSLKIYLDKNEEECKKLLGKYYIDVLLMCNAQFTLSPRRDKTMFANFKLLYKELLHTEENPAFFASFGFGHINPSNRNGLPYRLLENKDSPVKGKVSVIGIQYYHCKFSVENPTAGPAGTVSSLCKDVVEKHLDKSDSTGTKTITFLPKSELKNFACKEAFKQLDGLIIIRNFDAVSSWSF
jgi:hypothetical protein